MPTKLPKLPNAPLRLDDNMAVWAEFKEMERVYGCQSLGEGAPSYTPPRFLKDAMANAIEDGFN
jgi:hypothetical protein